MTERYVGRTRTFGTGWYWAAGAAAALALLAVAHIVHAQPQLDGNGPYVDIFGEEWPSSDDLAGEIMLSILIGSFSGLLAAVFAIIGRVRTRETGRWRRLAPEAEYAQIARTSRRGAPAGPAQRSATELVIPSLPGSVVGPLLTTLHRQDDALQAIEPALRAKESHSVCDRAHLAARTLAKEAIELDRLASAYRTAYGAAEGAKRLSATGFERRMERLEKGVRAHGELLTFGLSLLGPSERHQDQQLRDQLRAAIDELAGHTDAVREITDLNSQVLESGQQTDPAPDAAGE